MSMYAPDELTPEQLAMVERNRMRNEDLFNRLRRLLVEVLTPDDVQVLHATYYAISVHPDPTSLANWYEGLCQGILHTRLLRLGESTTDDEGTPP